MATEQQTEGQSPTLEVSELDQLLQKEFKPRSDAAKEAVESAVRTLAAEALAQTTLISSDAIAPSSRSSPRWTRSSPSRST